MFVAGHPGQSERYLPVSRLEYLRDIEFPAKVAIAEHVFKALTTYMQAGDQQRMKAAAQFEHWDNELKIFQGSLAFLKNPDVLKERKKQEQQWRAAFSAMKERGTQYHAALDEMNAACRELREEGRLHEFELNSQLFGLAHSLIQFSNAARDKPDSQVKFMTRSFSEFLDHVLDSSRPIHLEIEKIELTAWLESVKEQFAADSPFVKVALDGRSPEDAATQILAGAEKLTKKEAVVALLAHGATDIDKAKIPLLTFMAKLQEATKDREEKYRAIHNRFNNSNTIFERGLQQAFGAKAPPDASNTLRLGWGRSAATKKMVRKFRRVRPSGPCSPPPTGTTEKHHSRRAILLPPWKKVSTPKQL